MAWEYVPPKLIKPIFIEERFTAPIFNEVMERELRTARERIKEVDDERFRDSLIEVLNELIRFNGVLLRRYEFDETKTAMDGILREYGRVNPEILICSLDNITTGEYLSNSANIERNLYALLSGVTEYRYERFPDHDDNRALYFDMVLQLLENLYTGSGYKAPKLIKPIFIEERFTAPIFNEVMERELRTARETVKEIYAVRLRDSLIEVLNELIRFNGVLLRRYGFDETKATDGVWHTSDPAEDWGFFHINPRILTCPLDNITKGEYLSDYANIQEILYYLTEHLIAYRYSRFPSCTDKRALYFDMVRRLLEDLYSDNIAIAM